MYGTRVVTSYYQEEIPPSRRVGTLRSSRHHLLLIGRTGPGTGSSYLFSSYAHNRDLCDFLGHGCFSRLFPSAFFREGMHPARGLPVITTPSLGTYSRRRI